MTPGLLSVVLANFNHANVIADQITAVRNQSFGNYEFIILDDVSTDNSVAVIEAAVAGDPRVRFIRNEKNLGVVANYDKGRSLSTGEFLCTIAADDRVLPGFFEKCVAGLQQIPRAALACGDPATFHHVTLAVNPNPLGWSKEPYYFAPEEVADLNSGRFIGSWAAVFRREAYDRCMPTPEQWARLRWSHDWFLSYVMAFRDGLVYIPGILSAIRVDPQSFAQKGVRDWDQQKDVLAVILELLRSEAYQDVLPFFARGACLTILPGIVSLVMSRPDLWDLKTLMLIQRPLWEWNMNMSPLVAERIKQNAPRK